uniref:Uncharacterized protein n=1 Tax=Tetranychus urticae TaxID=32264 RepID=T1KV52_TETUR
MEKKHAKPLNLEISLTIRNCNSLVMDRLVRLIASNAIPWRALLYFFTVYLAGAWITCLNVLIYGRTKDLLTDYIFHVGMARNMVSYMVISTIYQKRETFFVHLNDNIYCKFFARPDLAILKRMQQKLTVKMDTKCFGLLPTSYYMCL